MADRPLRVVIAKLGLDGHDRGAKMIARYLKDAGMEVIYTGTRQTAEQVVSTVLQEDADVLGMSFLAGDHMVLSPKVMEQLKAHDLSHVLVVIGGIISRHHEQDLLDTGIKKVFYAGTNPNEIVQFVREHAASND